MAKIGWTIFVIIIAGLIAFAVIADKKGERPLGPDLSVAYPELNREHVKVGTKHGEYNSNPPSSGWHYEVSAKKKFYDEPIPDEYAIHNLEHGDVWIAYKPSIGEGFKDQLREYAVSKVLISPRVENDSDIALVAWGRVDKFNLENGEIPKDRISDFIERYRDRGPEKIPVGVSEKTYN